MLHTLFATVAWLLGLMQVSPPPAHLVEGDYQIECNLEVDSGLPFRHVVAEADVIVIARAQSSFMRFGHQLAPELIPNRRMILREYVFEPLHIVKSPRPIAGPISLSMSGGRTVSGVPTPMEPAAFVDGREYLVLLCDSPANDGYWLTWGISSAFDITEQIVRPLGHSVSAQSQLNTSRETFLRRVDTYAPQRVKRAWGYSCGE